MLGKVFVEVLARFTKEGQKIPLTITWENGKIYDIDKVTGICRAASLKAGGQGMRYSCKIKGHDTYLWLEDDKWFVEGK